MIDAVFGARNTHKADIRTQIAVLLCCFIETIPFHRTLRRCTTCYRDCYYIIIIIYKRFYRVRNYVSSSICSRASSKCRSTVIVKAYYIFNNACNVNNVWYVTCEITADGQNTYSPNTYR